MKNNMTLDDYINKYHTLREMPPLCIFSVLEKNNERILWIDPDAYRKNSFCIVVNKNREVTDELTFKELYNNIDNYLKNGWIEDKDFFIHKDIKTWIKDFTNSYGISIT